MYAFAKGAQTAGVKVIIAGAGGAAHLPGMTASLTDLPVLGVPIETKALKGMDSLLSIVQMPAGIPVGTLAIGEAGARNAGLMAAKILALSDPALAARVAAFSARQTESIPESVEDV
jgi:5-(carboxyamino)imidazole ribonucleotide mutase